MGLPKVGLESVLDFTGRGLLLRFGEAPLGNFASSDLVFFLFRREVGSNVGGSFGPTWLRKVWRFLEQPTDSFSRRPVPSFFNICEARIPDDAAAVDNHWMAAASVRTYKSR